MDGFSFVHHATVRFGDLDCRGHVNNAMFSSYLEDARIRWYLATAQPDEPAPMTYAVDMVLARTEIDFRGELRLFGETVAVGLRVARIGTKSVELEYRLCAKDGRVVAEAKSVLVGFDFDRGVTAPIPERWMRRLAVAAPSEPSI
jgi:acyl-CoA thioester hydrolase